MAVARFLQSAALVAVCAIAAGCGKKGPPLTPVVRVPSAAEVAATRRSGNDAYITVNVPQTNLDASKPASLARIDVYAATSLTPPARARFLEIAELVATVPVARAADPTDLSGTVIPDPTTGALQGTQVTVHDPLSAADMQPRELVELERERRAAAAAAATAVAGVPVIAAPRILRRYYMTVPFSDRGLAGPPSAIVAMTLTPLPQPVEQLHLEMRPPGVVLEWEAPGGLLGWLLERSLPAERPPFEEAVTAAPATSVVPSAELPPGPTTYNVYVDLAPDPLLLPARANAMPWAVPAPAPLNKAPLATLTYAEPIVLDGREHCYFVRAVRGPIESVPSPRECVFASDTEPPAPVTTLSTIVTENGITLLWDPNGEQDLGGYIVLRREAPGDTLVQLTDRPIRETRYDDRNVRPGVRYTYVVHAVDNRLPLPNVSEPAEISETAR